MLELVKSDARKRTSAAAVHDLARPRFDAVERLIDDVGIVQHAKFRVPDRKHGYCIDDTARALSLLAHLVRDGADSDLIARLSYACAGFINHAWNEQTGRFRNFMSWDRRWLDDGGCDDCNGRTLEALYLTAAYGARPDLREWAVELGQRVFVHAEAWTSLRCRAHVIKACTVGEGIVLDPREARDTLHAAGAQLLSSLRENAPWFDGKPSYDNARMPEALILAGGRLNDAEMTAAGLGSLDWLMAQQRSENGTFRPVPTSGFAVSNASHAAFDQQPLEAWASIDACTAAYAASGDLKWQDMARRAFLWFAGENDLGLSLVTPEDGGCYDGLTANGCNQNQGAESVLSYHLAAVAMRRLLGIDAG